MKGFSIGQKLGAGSAMMIGLILVEGFVCIEAIGVLSHSLDDSVKKASESTALLRGIHTTVGQMREFAKKTQFAYALNLTLDQRDRGGCSSCHSLPDPDQAGRQFATIAAGIQPKLQALAATGLSAEERKPLDRVDQSTSEWRVVFGEFLGKASAREFDAAHTIITDRMEPIRERIEKAAREMEAGQAGRLARSQAAVAADVKQRTAWLFGLQFAILLPTVFLVCRFIRRLSQQVRALCGAARDIADGDADRALSRLTLVGL